MKNSNFSIPVFSLILCLLLMPVILYSQINDWENTTNTNFVSSLYSDVDTLWVGTFGGLIKYNKKTGESTCYTRANSGLPSNGITGLAKDSKNNLWVACQYNGVGSFKNGVCTAIYNCKNTNMYSDQWAEGIYVDQNDSVFFGPDGSFNVLYKNQLKRFKAGDWIQSIPQMVKDIAQAPNGDIILATSYGLYKYRDGVMTLLNNITIQCNTVESDKNGNLWIGTAGEGMYKYNNESFMRYDSTNSESKNGAGCIAFDKNNEMWITNGRGLFNFKESGGSVSYFSSLMTSSAFKIAIDDNSIWIGTLQSGLYRFDLNTKQFEKIEHVITNIASSNSILDDIKIYPNPTLEKLNIQIPSNCTFYKTEIYDLMSKLFYQSTWEQSRQTDNLHTINMSSFPKGMYILRLHTNKETYSKKITLK